MLFFAIVFAALPAAILLTVALVARAVAEQPVDLVIPEYAPLPRATVLHDAVLVDADGKALAAALVDLAIRKKIRLLTSQDETSAATGAPADAPESRGRPGKRGKRGPLSVEIVDGARFTPLEQRVLAVFLGEQSTQRAVRRLSTDRGATGRRASALLRGVIGELDRAGFIGARSIRWPHNLCRVGGSIGILAAIIVTGVCAAAWQDEPGAPAGTVIGAVSLIATVAAMIVCPTPWRRFLPPSLPVRRHLAGMREYIRLAEADRLRVLQSPRGAERAPAPSGLERILLHERLLPYAILFGQEKEWAQVLRTDAAGIDADALESALDATLDVLEIVGVALQLADVAVTIVDAASSAGELVDAGGAVLDGIGSLLDF